MTIEIETVTHAQKRIEGVWRCRDCGSKMIEGPSGMDVFWVECPKCGDGVGLKPDRVSPATGIRVEVQI